MRRFPIAMIPVILSSVCLSESRADDPNASVDRTRQAVRGQWSVRSIEGPSGTLDASWFDGIRWLIDDRTLKVVPGAQECQDILGGIEMDFELAFVPRVNSDFGVGSWRHSKTWSDDEPYAIDIRCHHEGESVTLHGLLQLERDQMTLSIGSRKGRPASMEPALTQLGVYTLERTESPD